MRGANALGVDEIFEGNWNAMQRTSVTAHGQVAIGLARLVQRLIFGECREGMIDRIERLDPLDMGQRQRLGREFALTQLGTSVDDGEVAGVHRVVFARSG